MAMRTGAAERGPTHLGPALASSDQCCGSRAARPMTATARTDSTIRKVAIMVVLLAGQPLRLLPRLTLAYRPTVRPEALQGPAQAAGVVPPMRHRKIQILAPSLGQP